MFLFVCASCANNPKNNDTETHPNCNDSLFDRTSSANNLKYNDIATHPNYYDSLSGISFLKQIKPICLADSFKNQFSNFTSNKYQDSLILNSSYLKEGTQNINIFDQLVNSYKLKKPILIYFTAIGGVNCREMEENVLGTKEVSTFIRKEFIFIPLSVDDRTKLPKEHWIKNPLNNKHTKGLRPFSTIGNFNSHFQSRISRTCCQPMFIILDVNQELGIKGYTNGKEDFLDYMKQAIKKYKK